MKNGGRHPEVVLHPAVGPERVRVLCFHGGDGAAAEPPSFGLFRSQLQDAGGIACLVPRFDRGRGAIPDLVEDAAAALSQARRDLPPGVRLCVLGIFTGGFMALDAVRRAPEGIDGLVLVSPVTDTGPQGFRTPVFRGDEAAAALSPQARWPQAAAAAPPCLMLAGSRDETVPPEAVRRFAALWPAGRGRLVEFPHASHGFHARGPNDVAVVDLLQRFLLDGQLPEPAGPGRGPDALAAVPRPRAERLLPPGVTLVYGIGAQKAGTSWLFDYLGQSPDCHQPETKEVHYFDVLHGLRFHLSARLALVESLAAGLTPGVQADARSIETLQKLSRVMRIYDGGADDHRAYADYLLRGRAGQKLVCDISPSYAALDRAAFADMDRVGPAKFLFLMRDPIDRLWSQVRMAEKERLRGVAGADFQAACEARLTGMVEAGRIAGLPGADYLRTIAELEAAVPAHRIHYAFHEEPIRQQTADGICDFLDIARMPVDEGHRVNPGSAAALPPELEARLMALFEPLYTGLRARFGSRLPAGWRQPAAPPRLRQAPPRGSSTTIVFLHIPKTAGQTVHSEISRLGRKRLRISPVRLHGQVAPDANLPPGYDVHSGHIDWVDLETLPETRFAFTILRDPRQRIASFYFYLKREAEALTEEQLQDPAQTGKRNLLAWSASEYFFGGDAPWQRFIRDHYDNFYCTYLVSRRIRGSRAVEALDPDEVVERAVAAAAALDGIYRVENLDPLEADLAPILGGRPRLSGNYRNAGAHRGASRWDQLVDLLDGSDDRRRLDAFARLDDLLLRRLGLDDPSAPPLRGR